MIIDLAEIQSEIGIVFKDKDLLLEALTHSSCLNEPSMGLEEHNEALAWLGDALIQWIVSEREYDGELSKEALTDQRKEYVNKKYLAGLAVEYKLDKALVLPEGQVKIRGRSNQKNLHTVFEAIVGAIYKDQGYETAKRFITNTMFVRAT